MQIPVIAGFPQPPYVCKACGLAVLVRPGHEPLRACACKDPIVAQCSAAAHGSAGLKG